MKKFYKLKTDAVFKAIFCKEENKDILERLIEEAIDKKVEIIKLEVPELIKKNIYVRGKTLDVLVKSDNKLINIEVNSETNSSLKRRNAAFIFAKYSEITKVGESYSEMPDVIQINLTTDEYLPMVSKYTVFDIENKKNYIDNLSIYEFNILKIKEICYNKSDKYCLMSLLDCNLKDLNKIKGAKFMDNELKDMVSRVVDETKYLNEDTEFVKFMSDEDEDRLYINTMKAEGKKEGEKEEKILITKSMLDKNYDMKEISEITGLSIEEIENLK